MPTIIDVADATYSAHRNGVAIPEMEGTSLRPAFDGEPLERDPSICMEHESNRSIRVGQWKLVSDGQQTDYGTEDTWERYDLNMDRSETTDVASKHPETVQRLRGH